MISIRGGLLLIALTSSIAGCGLLKVNDKTVGGSPPSPGSSNDTSQPSGGGGGGGAGAAASGTAHDRFSVMDFKIGMPMPGSREGFTCMKQRPNQDSHCVKFIDARCAGKATSIGTLGSEGDYKRPPLGCFYERDGATYLDGVLQQTGMVNNDKERPRSEIKEPLENLTFTGTESRPSKIYKIYYMLGYDDLREDSKLYTALRTKYGEARDKNPPNQMRWKLDNTRMEAQCDWAHCWIVVIDPDFDSAEDARQVEEDAKAQHQNAAAPKL